MFCVYKGPYATVQEGMETHEVFLPENPMGRGEAGRLQSKESDVTEATEYSHMHARVQITGSVCLKYTLLPASTPLNLN